MGEKREKCQRFGWMKTLLVMAILVMAFALAGCQKKGGADGQADGNTGETGSDLAAAGAEDWQTQYDLGIRYLSEGKYEEAIIAFRAAIEIEPKRAAGYTSLAEAYAKNGQTDEARNVLLGVPEDVDDAAAVKKALEELQKERNEWFSYDNTIPYEMMTEEEKAATDRLIEGTIEGNEEVIKDGISQFEQLFSEHIQFRTKREEYAVKINISRDAEAFHTGENSREWECTSLTIELRTENGGAYYYHYFFDQETGGEQRKTINYVKGSCADWQWEGAVTQREEDWSGSEFDGYGIWRQSKDETTGTVSQNLRTGTFTTNESYRSGEGDYDWTIIRTYEGGRMINETIIEMDGTTNSYESEDDSIYGAGGYLWNPGAGDWQEVYENEIHW